MDVLYYFMTAAIQSDKNFEEIDVLFVFLNTQENVHSTFFFCSGCNGCEPNNICVEGNNNGFLPRGWVGNNWSHVNEFKAPEEQRREDF